METPYVVTSVHASNCDVMKRGEKQFDTSCVSVTFQNRQMGDEHFGEASSGITATISSRGVESPAAVCHQSPQSIKGGECITKEIRQIHEGNDKVNKQKKPVSTSTERPETHNELQEKMIDTSSISEKYKKSRIRIEDLFDKKQIITTQDSCRDTPLPLGTNTGKCKILSSSDVSKSSAWRVEEVVNARMRRPDVTSGVLVPDAGQLQFGLQHTLQLADFQPISDSESSDLESHTTPTRRPPNATPSKTYQNKTPGNCSKITKSTQPGISTSSSDGKTSKTTPQTTLGTDDVTGRGRSAGSRRQARHLSADVDLALTLTLKRWAEYLGKEDLQQAEVENALQCGYTDTALQMVSDSNTTAWGLVRGILHSSHV